nr:hypothetical protein [Tanacetum cinerariifolium]
IALYTSLVDVPNNNNVVAQGAALSGSARQVVKEMRNVLHRLDVRIDNLRDEIPGLAQRYDDARRTDANYVPQSTGPREGGDGSDGGIGREAAGNAFGPEAQPFQ